MQKAMTADRQAIWYRGFNNTEQRLEKLNRAVDRIRDKYGFTAIQTGSTLRIRQ
jgi:hypothetical protein